MRLLSVLLLLSAFSLAQKPPIVTITNACCASLSRIDFNIQGTTGVFSLPYGVTSTTINATAGSASLHAAAGGDLNFTSGQFTLAQDKAYTIVFYGNLDNPKVVGPIENLIDGDPKKIRIRFGLASTFIQQNRPPNSQVRLRVLCPSFGNASVVDIIGTDGAFSPAPPTYSENGTRVFHETCKLQLVQVVSAATTVLLEQSYPLGTANNYTVLVVGSNSTNLAFVLFNDNK